MEGYDVIIQEDGLKALNYLKSHFCDLIVTDIVMPHMDGLTMLKELRNQPQTANTPVIIISAKATDAIQQELIENGSNLFLKKPCDTENLINSVKTLLTV